MEQVTKATMLGHLLPVLLTTLMHPNLQTLTLADALMPQLVQLVLYTSQVRVLPIPNVNCCIPKTFFLSLIHINPLEPKRILKCLAGHCGASHSNKQFYLINKGAVSYKMFNLKAQRPL